MIQVVLLIIATVRSHILCHLTAKMICGLKSESLPESLQQGGFTFVQGAQLYIVKIDKTPLIYNVSYFNLRGIGTLFGGA